MDIKFDVYLYPENLGALYKDNEIDSNGLEAKVDLNLNEVNGIAVNFKIGQESYTDYVEIKDILARTVQIPFKTSVLKAGNNSFELVATMKNGDVKTSRTYAYQIVKSLENPNAVEADTYYPILIDLINQVSAITTNGDGGISGHTHANKWVLDAITSSKVNEWNNKADSIHTHNEYATKTYVEQKIETTNNRVDELFSSVGNGKELLARALTDKGIQTLASESFEEMARKILSLGDSTGEETVKTFNLITKNGDNLITKNGDNLTYKGGW